MKPIGVFGGTFDPVHFGHIQPVLDVCHHTGIDEVHYIPNLLPPHRDIPLADARHRWNMLALALAQYPQLVADDRELKRTGQSYMVPTLRSLRSEFRMRPLCLMLGMDAFLKIQSWYRWACILRLANIVVMQRPGYAFPNRLPPWWTQALEPNLENLYRRVRGRIFHVEVRPMNISASELRRSLARGMDASKYMPPGVADYLDKHNLYTFAGGGAN